LTRNLQGGSRLAFIGLWALAPLLACASPASPAEAPVAAATDGTPPRPAASPAPLPAGEPAPAPPANVTLSVAQVVPSDQPAPPAPPGRPTALDVPGFAPASHVGPTPEAGAPPWPVTFVLHGNFDRPEWECEWWQEAAAFRGWVLCPRGIRTPWATLAEDRWTYGNRQTVRREMDAALRALQERYPGLVHTEGQVLAGFSLGAIHAPTLAEESPGRFTLLFLVEGGVDKLTPARLAKLRRAGLRGVGLAMSAPGFRKAARRVAAAARRTGLPVELVEMPGAGHNYATDFGPRARLALERLLRPAPPTKGP